MKSLTKTALYLSIPAAIGIVASPLLATTPKHEDLGRTFVNTTEIELVFPRYAQVGGDDVGGGGANSGGEEEDGFRRNRRAASGPEVIASTEQTSIFIRKMEEAERICEFMGDEYRVSCFAVTYRELADEMPANGDYAEAKEVLLSTAKKLDKVVRRNIDRKKPALRARLTADNGQSVQTPPIRAVKSANVARINNEASNILAEAETVLLRSASSDATRAIHYQRIAAAVGSNKVLLRSA